MVITTIIIIIILCHYLRLHLSMDMAEGKVVWSLLLPIRSIAVANESVNGQVKTPQVPVSWLGWEWESEWITNLDGRMAVRSKCKVTDRARKVNLKPKEGG